MGTKKMVVGALDPATGQGPSFESQVHALQLAEVEVDTGTGEVTVLKMTCAVDAGRVIHPLNFSGQIEGGMDMGVGLALRESYIAGETKDWVTFKYPVHAHRLRDGHDRARDAPSARAATARWASER